jgi:hypothetical protein
MYIHGGIALELGLDTSTHYGSIRLNEVGGGM